MNPVTTDDIRWGMPHARNLEDRPAYLLLDCDLDEVFDYLYLLQCELRAVRTLWHDTLDALSETVRERDRAVADQRRMRRGR